MKVYYIKFDRCVSAYSEVCICWVCRCLCAAECLSVYAMCVGVYLRYVGV